MTAILALLLAQEIQAVPEGEATVRVVSAGRFETTFTKRKGFVATWFDLKHDPDKKRDLGPVLDENGLFWIKIGKPVGDGSWYANPVETMTLLEPGPARVRVRLQGAHMRYGMTDPKNAWKELRFDQTWTLYPDGSAFLVYALVTEEPVPFKHFLVITKSNGAWGPQGKGEGKGEVRIAGESGAEKPSSKAPTALTLQWSDGPTYFTDILMVARKGKYAASYWNEGYLDKDIRCAFDFGTVWPEKTLAPGRHPLHFLVRLADDINSSETASRHAEDYRLPDSLKLTKGELDGDGYDEEEGCYVLKASPEGVSFTLHGKAIPRVNPAFKVTGWPGALPEEITLDGQPIARGKGLAVSLRDGTLVLQLMATIREDATLSLSPPAR